MQKRERKWSNLPAGLRIWILMFWLDTDPVVVILSDPVILEDRIHIRMFWSWSPCRESERERLMKVIFFKIWQIRTGNPSRENLYYYTPRPFSQPSSQVRVCEREKSVTYQRVKVKKVWRYKTIARVHLVGLDRLVQRPKCDNRGIRGPLKSKNGSDNRTFR